MLLSFARKSRHRYGIKRISIFSKTGTEVLKILSEIVAQKKSNYRFH